ncbi:MAG: zf-HC2 domain-containing protein [Planctomycetota bacterium]
MDCQDYQKWISRWVDNELEDEQARMLDEHLAGCDVCRKYRRDLETMRSFFKNTDTPVPSHGLRDRVLAAAREEHAGRNTFMVWAQAAKRACAAALILAALTIGSFYIGGSGTLHAVDTNKEIHYEDLFQKGRLDSADMLEAMLKTSNPRKAMDTYCTERRSP